MGAFFVDAVGLVTFAMPKAPSQPLPPDAAEKLLKADAANLIKKVKSGKTLTRAERAHLLAMAEDGGESGVDTNKATADNYVELARLLGVTRDAIYKWKRRKDAPKPQSNGKHDVSEWRRFCSKHGLKHKAAPGEDSAGDEDGFEDMDVLKARKLIVEIAEREHKLATLRGEYVENALVQEMWASRVGQALSLLRNKLENELPPHLATLDDGAEIRVEMGKVIDEFAKTLHEGRVEE